MQTFIVRSVRYSNSLAITPKFRRKLLVSYYVRRAALVPLVPGRFARAVQWPQTDLERAVLLGNVCLLSSSIVTSTGSLYRTENVPTRDTCNSELRYEIQIGTMTARTSCEKNGLSLAARGMLSAFWALIETAYRMRSKAKRESWHRSGLDALHCTLVCSGDERLLEWSRPGHMVECFPCLSEKIALRKGLFGPQACFSQSCAEVKEAY